MSKKIEISGNFLRITDTITNFVDYDRGARLSEIRIYENDNTFYIYYGENYAKQYEFNELVDVNGNPFANINDFIAWKDINTGFKTASGGSGAETDPFFSVSEAKLFVAGDKTKLDNAITITNIGSLTINETIPQGAILNKEYAVSGLNANKPVTINWGGFIFPLTAFVSYRALRDNFINITIENKGDVPLSIIQTININN